MTWTEAEVGTVQNFAMKQASGVPRDLSGATMTLEVWPEGAPPDATPTSLGLVLTDATNGRCKYTRVAADLTAGRYRAKAKHVVGSSILGYSRQIQLEVVKP